MQKSVWISPHPFEDDIGDFLSAEKMGDYVHVFVSESYLFGDALKLVNKTWNLSELNSAYLEFVQSSERKEKKAFADNYLQIVMNDPFLPRELLPKPWWGDKAREVFKK